MAEVGQALPSALSVLLWNAARSHLWAASSAVPGKWEEGPMGLDFILMFWNLF